MQALNTEKMGCTSANHKDTAVWMQVWRKIGDWAEAEVKLRMVWTKLHTMREEKANMSYENLAVWAIEKANEGVKPFAILDGTDMAEQVAKAALDTRNEVYAEIKAWCHQT